MHRYIVERAGQPELDLSNLPANDVTSELAHAIGTAVAEFGEDGAAVLFIVQPDERNSYDQQVPMSPCLPGKPVTSHPRGTLRLRHSYLR